MRPIAITLTLSASLSACGDAVDASFARGAPALAVQVDRAPVGDTDPDTETTETVTFAVFSQAPLVHLDERVAGEAIVDAVISDRALWLTTPDRGPAVLVILRADATGDAHPALVPGQRLWITARSHGRRDADALGGDLDAAARDVLGDQPAFLAAFRDDIEVLGQPPRLP